MEDLSFPFFFYPYEAKERIKRNCNHLGTPTSLRREAPVAEWFPPSIPFDFGRKSYVNHVRESCDNWKGDKKCLGSGSMLV